MRQWCRWHRDWVPEQDAMIVALLNRDWCQFACRRCAKQHGILPWKSGQIDGEIRYRPESVPDEVREGHAEGVGDGNEGVEQGTCVPVLDEADRLAVDAGALAEGLLRHVPAAPGVSDVVADGPSSGDHPVGGSAGRRHSTKFAGR